MASAMARHGGTYSAPPPLLSNMVQRFVRCRACGMPHPAQLGECPSTRTPIGDGGQSSPTPIANEATTERNAVAAVIKLVAPSTALTLDDEPTTLMKKKADRGHKLPAIKRLAGRYLIRGFLARGGMGVIYDAIDERLQRPVAIKVLIPEAINDPIALGRFQTEVKLLGALAHPRIVTIFDAGTTDDGSPFLVMEKLVGEPLSSRIKREGALPIASAIEIAGQVLDALIATHARNILHRDLKPENVFLERTHDRTVSVRLLDFGLARKTMAVVEDRGAESHFTRPGRVVGTPAYMAFEQAMGERDLDGRTDLYALGVIFFECVTAQLPWSAKDPMGIAVEMHARTPTLIRAYRPDAPAWLEHLVRMLMARERELRPQDAKLALRLLRAGEAGFVTSTGEITLEKTRDETS